MLISTWLTAVKKQVQSPWATKRRINGKQAVSHTESLEARALLTTTLQAVRPNVGEFLTSGEVRHIAPQELTLQFSLGSTITPGSINNQSIQVSRSGNDGVFGTTDDVPVTIGYVGPGNVPNEVVLRFGENLPDDQYRIFINGTSANGLTATVNSTSGPVADPVTSATFDFELDLGPQVVAVDPQPILRNASGQLVQQRNRIVVHFNNDRLDTAAAENTNFYQLIFTNDTVSTEDDVRHFPQSATYNATNNTVTLIFASDIANLSGAGSYRLRIGNAEALPVAPAILTPGTDPGSSFATANNALGVISGTGATSRIIRSSIDAQFLAYPFPGDEHEPGHRHIEVEHHLEGGPDSGASGIPYIPYNFRSDYGFDPTGNPLENAITEAQKERAREIFEIFSTVAGIDFRETESSGLTIVTGDMRALDPEIPTGPGGVAGLAGGGMAIMDMAETWNNSPGGSWFNVAMHEIGHLLGLGHTYDLPDPTNMGSGNSGSVGTGVEPMFPGDHDIVHLRHLYRPDSVDIDLYRFQVTTTSTFSAEIVAERMLNSSRLDSVLRLYKEVDGVRELIAQNDNYFSKDSFLELTLEPAVYYIGVSSTGNDAYDPTIADTGIGGTSQGDYELRVNFRPDVFGPGAALVDTTGRTFDGDNDGIEGGVYNFWFRTASVANTLFVDKAAGSFLRTAISLNAQQIGVQRTEPFSVNDVIRINNEEMRVTGISSTTRTLTVDRGVNATAASGHSLNAPIRRVAANGSTANPYAFIGDALAAAQPGQIVRIVGNGGTDGNLSTLNDSFSYEIGLNTNNQPLPDGASLEAPRGVTVMIDKGALIKIRRGWIGTGSSTAAVDRSGSAIQVLGVPSRQVIMTSWNDTSIGVEPTQPRGDLLVGDWGGIIFRNQIDRAQNRFNVENEGIFVNYVAWADLRYGGGTVTIDTATQTINPIHMDRAQPTIANNTIRLSQDSAMSADPDSFEELTFHSPRFQGGKTPFTVDYKRVGPEIHGNTLVNNGNNALFVRIDTLAGGGTERLTVPGRFDDTDIVHLISQNLIIQGTPGGAFTETLAPTITLTTVTPFAGGNLPAGTYRYRVVFTDENGFESPASAMTAPVTRVGTGSLRLAQLPTVPAGSVYTGRRIYRSEDGGAGPFSLIADLNKSGTVYVDDGRTFARTLGAAPTVPRDRARIDARLSVDPGIVVKLQGARIQTGFGGQFIAEGAPGRQVIFTSRLDDRFGAGGTFDTNNDDALGGNETTPSAGNWGGIYIGHTGSVSIDRALITFGGGSVPNGGQFARFNTVEIHQATGRIRNTTFERNANGTGGNRNGVFPNGAGTIFVRASQPVILDNTFISNTGAAVNINVNSLNKDFVVDPGRATGMVDASLDHRDNQGPLVRGNVLDGNTLNGMLVRGETLTTQSIWDDTDIVHILQSEIYVPNLHTFGGLRLESSPRQSLVVKLLGANAGFTAGGFPLDIVDRIGGMLHVVGQPGFPVIMTSLHDDSVGAGFNLSGTLQKDTNGNGSATTPGRGDWRGLRIDRYSHDRNVAVYLERESTDRLSADINRTPGSAENLGSLAEKEQWGDENLRLGFDIQGFISNPRDVDVYSFSGVAGSHVWLDIDRSTHSLDTIVELIDSNGMILAQSDSYISEKAGAWNVFAGSTQDGDVKAFGLDYSPYKSQDHFSTNQRDAGMRVILPGTTGVRGTYFVRVRSSNIDPTTGAPRADLLDNSKVRNGLTSGVYQLQIRLQETDEFPGTTVQYADIRYANVGIHIVGQPVHSPLSGEFEETEGVTQNLGNLMNTDRATLAIRGRINNVTDVDFYQFEVNYTHTQQIAGVSLQGPHVPVVFDLDYADGLARADLSMAIYDSQGRLILVGRDSNVTDDQPGPLEGTDMDDLSRGSVGTFDPFIGAVELPGGTYTLAVYNNRQIPSVLDQFSNANSATPLLRLEPVNSVARLFEERFGNNITTSATGPLPPLFGTGNGPGANNTIPYHLGDVVLFVATAAGTKGTDKTTMYMVNPFTGMITNIMGSFGAASGDIAMRPDGQLYTFSTSTTGTQTGTSDNSGNVGNYLRIDTGTAETTVIGDDGITANLDNLNAGDDTIVASGNNGFRYNAMMFTTGSAADVNSLFAIGDRFDHSLPANSNVAAQYTTNVLWRFNMTTGAVNGNGNNRTATGSAAATQGAGTTQVEIAQITTAPATPLPGGVRVTGMARVGNNNYVVTSDGGFYSLNLTSGRITLITTFAGSTFTSLSRGPQDVENNAYQNMLFAMTEEGDLLAFNTSGVLQPVFYNGTGRIGIGLNTLANQVTTGIAFSTLGRNLWGTTTHRGTDPGHGVETRFDDSVVSSRVNGGTSLYFGNQRTGFNQGNANNLTTEVQRNINFPGGAHGAVISNEFSLEGYNRADKPVLYFNYFLETEGAAHDPDTNAPILMRDAFRVYVGDSTGTWNLLTTNNSYRNPNRPDEFDLGPDGSVTSAPTTQTFPDVVETFDNTNGWRQARVDLSNYAGRDNLRLRFEFSTAGSFNTGDFSTSGQEFYARPGARLRDGQTYIVNGLVQYELDMGYTLVVPASTLINDGETITIQGTTFEFDKLGNGVSGANIPVVIPLMASPEQVATALRTAIQGAGIPELLTFIDGNRINLIRSVAGVLNTNVVVTQSASPGVVLEGAPGYTVGNTGVVIHSGMTAGQVADVMAQAMADNYLPAGAYFEVDPPATTGNNALIAPPLLTFSQNLNALTWTTTANNLITDSTTLPHVSILGTSFELSTTDYYEFSVPAGGGRVVIDIDGIQQGFAPVVNLLNSSGTVIQTLTNASGLLEAGDAIQSPYLDLPTLAAGTYYIQVSANAGGGGALPEQPYVLHLSVAGKATGAGAPTAVPRSIIKTHNDMIRMIRQNVVDPGPMALTTQRRGDLFGAFNASFQNGVANRPGALRGMANNFEGVYIDDIILGFAERGEMVVGAPSGNSFISNPDISPANYPSGNPYLGIDLGPYDVEIRRASDYAETQSGSPTNGLYRAIDTNDRQAELLSITIPNSWQIADGSTLTLSDGINQVIFEFNQVGGVTTTPGSFPIDFDPMTGETSISLARKLRNAINSSLVQSILGIKASLSDGAATGTASTSSRLHLTGNALVALSPELVGSVLQQRYTDTFGDQNNRRDQGQLVIQTTSVTESADYGIIAEAAPRTSALPGPGSVRNLHTINDDRLVTGVVLMNNVIANNVAGGILFRGDQGTAPGGQVPYGRIVNNTIVGIGSGFGIRVENTASPTILNNIVADFGTGIFVDVPSQIAGTVIGYSVYRGNGTNSNAGLGELPIVMNLTEPLFVDQARGNYYLAPFSRAIDSALTSLGDRAAILRIKDPLFLDGRDKAGSPILAPEFDLYGQLRGNDPDVENTDGQGVSVVFDRGAIDRVDRFRPQAILVAPEDQSVEDGDPDPDEVWIDQVQILRQFRIRFIDEGIGIDHSTVDKSQFVLKRVDTDGVTEIVLVEGVDYTFAYDEINSEVILTAATFFADPDTEVRYILLVDNNGTSPGDTVDGIRDRAGNYLLGNRTDGTTRFDIVLTDGVNDAPVITHPGTISVNEDTNLIFANNSISIFDQDAHLGTNILTVTLTATNGRLWLGSIPAGLQFATGNGTSNVTMTFTGVLQDINAALNGLRFRPLLDYFGPATITITANDNGEFSGPPAETTETINITVNPVNDPPTFNPLVNPPAVNEDAGLQTIPGFMTGQVAGPANETPPQTITTRLTVVSVNSAWTVDNFFAVAPRIAPLTGTLQYRAAADVNGTATIRVEVVDSLGLASAPQFITITVNPVNDVPVLVRSGIPIRSLEDQLPSPVQIPLVNSFAPARNSALDELNSQTLTWSIADLTIIEGNLEFDSISIMPDGTLRYISKKDTAGRATLQVRLTDSGPGNAPNVNRATFNITINVVQVNDAPVAVTGNYTVDEGYALRLNASRSFDVDAFFGDTLRYEWDLDNDGVFETSSGSSPTLNVPWAQLRNLGLTAPSQYTIRLRVTDNAGAFDIATASLATLIVDYGDAPDSYGTRRNNNGAAHTIRGNLFLGATVDSELNGQPNATATGDGADEDGVSFPTNLETHATRDLRTFVDVVASRDGKLDAWLDLNRDGVFDHATEHLFGGVSLDVVAGTQRIFFTIPAGSSIGTSFMRFRLSTAGSLLPTGRAVNGEVEDYAVQIRGLQSPVTPTITHPIDFNPGDGEFPQTTDTTPTIEWTQHLSNFNYRIVIRNSFGNPVLTVPASEQTTATSWTVQNPLAPGRYTAEVTAFNRIGTASGVATWTFDVVTVEVSAPAGGVNTPSPVIEWNHVPGSTAYTIQIVDADSGSTIMTRTVSLVDLDAPGRYTLPVNLRLGRYRVRVRATDSAGLIGDWGPFRPFQIRTAPSVTGPVSETTQLRPRITWTQVPGAASYNLQLFNMTDNVMTHSVTGLTVANFLVPANLPMARYRVVVTAVNSLDFAGFPSEAYFFIVSPVVSVISPNGRLNDATPTFGWNPVDSADSYELIVRQDFGDFAIVYSQAGITSTIHNVADPLPLGRYTFTIQAVNDPAPGTSGPRVFSTVSTPRSFTVTEAPVITGPAATTFVSRPDITWVNPPLSGNDAVSDLRLQRRENNSLVTVLVRNRIPGESFSLPTDLAIGTYIVSVRTYSTADPVTVSEWSIDRSFRVTVAPTPIGPTGRTSEATPTLNWQGVLGGQTYEIVIRNLSRNVVAYNVTGIQALNFRVPSDLPIGRYDFKVRARTAFGEFSDFSSVMPFQIVTAPALSGPGSSTFNTTPSFSWTDMRSFIGGVVAGATGYDFRIDSVAPNGAVTTGVLRSLAGTSFTVPSALAPGRYRAQVRARNADTVGDFSQVLEFIVGGNPVLNAVGVNGRTNSTPTITWQSVDGAASYEIFIAFSSTPNVPVIQQSGIGATSFNVTSALSRGTYRVWVRAVNSANGQLSGLSNIVEFTVVDASELRNEDGTSEYLLTVSGASLSGASLSEMSTDTTISMLPSYVSGSLHPWMTSEGDPTDSEDSVLVPELSEITPGVAVQTVGEVVIPVYSENRAEATLHAETEHTDDVLAGWHKQAWWDGMEFSPVSQPSTETPAQVQDSEDATASVGLLGALLAWAPRSVRRRSRRES